MTEREYQEELLELFLDLHEKLVLTTEAALQDGRFKNLSRNDLKTLKAIGLHGEKTMGETAQELRITLGTLTVAINKLVKKGYVKKEKSNTDGRVVYVRLTDKGLRIDKIHQYFHVKMVKDISKEMTDEEKEVLIHGMEKLNGFFRKKLSRLSDENETSEP